MLHELYIEYRDTNAPAEQVLEQVRANRARDLPRVDSWAPAHGGVASVVGGGPSLRQTWPLLEGEVWALNGAYDWLRERGVTPHAMVICDARELTAKHVTRPSDETTFYVATQCHPRVFERLKGKKVVTFDCAHDGLDGFVIGGGSTVALQAIALLYVLGYRSIHLHGLDSSYEDAGHAYAQPESDADEVIPVVVAGREFRAAKWMAAQAIEFQALANEVQGCRFAVHGDGLLPFVVQQIAKGEGVVRS